MKTIESVLCWKTSDGQLFESKERAERGQAAINMVDRFGADNIYDSFYTVDNKEDLRIILNFLKKVYGFRGVMMQFMGAKCPLKMWIDWKKKTVEYNES